MSESPDYAGPLPQCEGPQLHPFDEHKGTVKFLRLISNVDSEGHAHVFEVSIGTKRYALKLFKFYNDEEDREGLDEEDYDKVSINRLRCHMDPFYRECRAFGKVIDSKANGKIAVRCYGHLAIPARREQQLKRRFGIDTWNRPDYDSAKPVLKRQPLRAIIKDLILETVPFTIKQVNKILKDLKRLRRLGVYPMDVQSRNYVGGLLVDMSIAITEPHYLFQIRPEWFVDELKQADLFAYDFMMKDENIMTWCRATRNEEYCRAKLRSFKTNE